ncbi:MAG: hypothetical protein P0Y48_10515 [Candidatus Microbacterium phytovorans]|uniref:Uncharacterized protein n=1 Tax=Candidatus Microbacterium phytovorans TaxID=3121374 RepID=A0AAJ5VZ19_9MICO|nr:hypothetical protein [Microbacterium sp.]WEK12894.1 MAG: hypothetical protein P0Y48_10515 [Microbacterium sp.]
MVTLLLDSAQLEVVLSPIERALSFRSAGVRVDRSAIVKVQLTDDAWTWLRGVPSPGTHVRGILAMGTWKSSGGADFVVVQRRKPAVVIDLDPSVGGGAEFERLVLTTRHGVALVQALQLEAETEAADVVDIVAPHSAARPRRTRAPKVAPVTP